MNPRRKTPLGFCRDCGCTDFEPCLVSRDDSNDVFGCHWLDSLHSRCSSCFIAIRRDGKPDIFLHRPFGIATNVTGTYEMEYEHQPQVCP